MKKIFGNRQYTDKNHHFIIVEDEEINNYKILKEIGEGMYGKVCTAFNRKYEEDVVFKIIKKKLNYRLSAVKEIDFLKNLSSSYNKEIREFTSLYYNHFDFNGHLFIELKKYGRNLYEGTKHKALKINEILTITIDLIEGLNFLKKNDIIHADLKPENILYYNEKEENVVICDFGLSLSKKNVNVNIEIQSMWYRAPEVLFNIEYDYCIDLWSFACILFELIYMNALFRASNQKLLFQKFLAFMGTPNKEYQTINKYTKGFFDLNHEPIISFDNNMRLKSISKRNYLLNYESKSKSITYLIFKIIRWNIDNRICIEDCVNLIDDIKKEIKLNSESYT